MTIDIDFYKRNKYIIDVEQLPSSNGCTAKFPGNILFEKKIHEKMTTYILQDDYVDIYSNTNSKQLNVTVPTVKYARRPLVLLDVLFNALKIHIDGHLIVYTDRDGKRYSIKNGIFALLESEMDQHEQMQEHSLIILLPNVLLNTPASHIAEENDVLDGYRLLVSYLEDLGGLK